MWYQWSISQGVSGFCHISGVHIQVPVPWDVVFFFHAAFTANNNRHFAFAFIASQLDPAADLSHCSRVFRFARLKYFGNSGQTSCDVLCAAAGSGSMSNQLACLNRLTLADLNSGSRRQVVNVEYFTVGVLYDNLRMLIALMLDYHRFADCPFSLFFNSNCLAFDDIYKPYKAGHFGQNRRTVRVPCEQQRTGFNLPPVLNQNNGTVGHFEPVELSVLCVQNSYFAVAFECDYLGGCRFINGGLERDRIYVTILNFSCLRRFLFAFKNSSGRDAAGMERA
ncbi:hypothetical protein ES703_39183 [subsurface metagenome]